MKECVKKFKLQTQLAEDAKLKIWDDLNTKMKDYDEVVQMNDDWERVFNQEVQNHLDCKNALLLCQKEL